MRFMLLALLALTSCAHAASQRNPDASRRSIMKKLRLRKKQMLAAEFIKKFPKGGQCIVQEHPNMISGVSISGFLARPPIGTNNEAAAEKRRLAWFGHPPEMGE